ncbi:chemotaxis protein CheW [Neomoorella humiferrea]|uniref:chemotaxis protein CheW n=1 Tax=Neomoorella humiferrea TaxID=676965 RepID=UPI003D8AE59E
MEIAGGSVASLDQYVVFRLGQESYGIAIEYLQEIIRVPHVVKVPLTPPYMWGLANLRGNILPSIKPAEFKAGSLR